MPAWPVSLPAPLMSSVRFSRGENKIRSQVDRGAPRVRRRSLSTPDGLSFSILMSDEKKAALEGFYDDDTGSGVMPFTMRCPVAKEDRTFRFTGVYDLSLNDGFWVAAI